MTPLVLKKIISKLLLQTLEYSKKTTEFTQVSQPCCLCHYLVEETDMRLVFLFGNNLTKDHVALVPHAKLLAHDYILTVIFRFKRKEVHR